MRDPVHTISVFGHVFFSFQSRPTFVGSALGLFGVDALYEFTFYLLTYLLACLHQYLSTGRNL